MAESIRCVDCADETALQCARNFEISRQAIDRSVQGALDGEWTQLDPKTGQSLGRASMDLVLQGQSVLHDIFTQNLQAKQHDIGCTLDTTAIEAKLSTTQGR